MLFVNTSTIFIINIEGLVLVHILHESALHNDKWQISLRVINHSWTTLVTPDK